MVADAVLRFEDLPSDLIGLGQALKVFHILLNIGDDLIEEGVDKSDVLHKAVKYEFLRRIGERDE